MAYLLTNICTKIYCNRTIIVTCKIIDGGWMVSFFDTQCMYSLYFTLGTATFCCDMVYFNAIRGYYQDVTRKLRVNCSRACSFRTALKVRSYHLSHLILSDLIFLLTSALYIAATSNWIASQCTAQLAVAVTNHSALSSDEMRSDEISCVK